MHVATVVPGRRGHARLPDPARELHDPGEDAEPLVVPAGRAVGRGRVADPARARATRSARAGWGSSAPGVGIHGTSNSGSVGTAASHGCIRMHISSAEWLFERVRIGTPVFIVAS